MAYSDLRGLLCCPLCLGDFADPVTLNCGHNFCRVCIKKALESQISFHTCPQCGQGQGKRPRLIRNKQLGDLAQQLRSTEPTQKSSAVYCVPCTDSLVLATKTCLLCGVSICPNHLRLHSKSTDHVLVDVNHLLLHQRCPMHNRALDQYCWDCKACICEDCSSETKHHGHQVLMMDYALDVKKNRLRHQMETLTAKWEKTRAQICRLEKAKVELTWKMARVNAMLNTADAFAVLSENESDGLFFCDVQEEKRRKVKMFAVAVVVLVLAGLVSVVAGVMYSSGKVPRY